MRIKRNINGNKKSISIRPVTFDFSIIIQIIAFLISFATNKSIGWAIVHFIFGLWYIIYWIITGDNANEEGMQEIINYWKTVF